jgi:hypothetical protein
MVQVACRQTRLCFQQYLVVTSNGWGEVTAARRIRAKAASDLLKRVADNGRAARLLGLHRSTLEVEFGKTSAPEIKMALLGPCCGP